MTKRMTIVVLHFRYPGYYTIKNNKFGYYSIEKVSN